MDTNEITALLKGCTETVKFHASITGSGLAQLISVYTERMAIEVNTPSWPAEPAGYYAPRMARTETSDSQPKRLWVFIDAARFRPISDDELELLEGRYPIYQADGVKWASDEIRGVIAFDVLSMAPERINVTAMCHLPAAQPYFATLLGEIANDLPETLPELGRYLTPQPAASALTMGVDLAPNRKKVLDQACIEWAKRGCAPGFDMQEFLSEISDKTKVFVTVREFKRVLVDAGNRNLICKVNHRWRPMTAKPPKPGT